MSKTTEIYIDNDHIIKLEGLKDSDDNVIDNADVEVTIQTYSGDVVAGQNFPVTMSPVSGEAGSYEAILEDGVELRHNVTYILEVEATQNNLKGNWRQPVKAVYRQF